MMLIDISGDAYALLDDFIRYATGKESPYVADALDYCEDSFLVRAKLLKKAVLKSIWEDEMNRL
jgi:hypothetical protein